MAEMNNDHPAPLAAQSTERAVAASMLAGAGSKPRLKYSEVFKTLDLDSLEQNKTELLLGGEVVVYAGHHYDTLIWLKRKGKIGCFRQIEVMPHLRLR